MEYKPVDLNCKKLRKYIKELDEYQNALYPPEYNMLDSLNALGQENVYFLGAYDKGELCGFCAIKIFSDFSELKRLFVNKQHRGKGIAKILISKLEKYSIMQGVHVVKAETGHSQVEAMGLYAQLGYLQTGPFGGYLQNPYSRFYSKKI